jgi:hypothetical protein
MNNTDSVTGQSRTVLELSQPPLALIGLLLVQAAIGYEWLISGLTKVARGGFPSGLADQLRDSSQGSPGWYLKILDHLMIPHAQAFGYLTEIGELIVGVVLLGGALTWLLVRNRIPFRAQALTWGLVGLAAFGGFFMNVNFHLADGAAPAPWTLPNDLFAEGVDIDSLMAAIQVVLAGFAVSQAWRAWGLGRRLEETRAASSERSLLSP